ncbi:MAG: hypothetical protein JOY51_08910 [Nevskia sp.]|nr:hypothetical protein [Nevskia sp.]
MKRFLALTALVAAAAIGITAVGYGRAPDRELVLRMWVAIVALTIVGLLARRAGPRGPA